MKELVISFWEQSDTMENPDLVLQETGLRPTYSRLNYVPSGNTLRRDAISSLTFKTRTFVGPLEQRVLQVLISNSQNMFLVTKS